MSGATKRRTVTLADVAAAAGVDASTVSRHLNSSARLSPESRARVERAIAALGYSPHRAARRLAGGRAGVIGVVVPDLTNPFFAAIARGVQRSAASKGDLTMIADADNRARGELDLTAQLVRDTDAVVLCSPTAASAALVAAAAGHRAVVVNRRIRGWPCVAADQAAAVAVAHSHLVELGHERIAYVRGPASKWTSKVRDRTATALGMTMLGPVETTVAGGAAAAGELGDVTAVVAHNDPVAVGLIDALERAGRRVPEDVSVVGCDDVAIAAAVRPRLTTVTMPLEDLGKAAVDVLDGGSRTADLTLGVHLTVRESTVHR